MPSFKTKHDLLLRYISMLEEQNAANSRRDEELSRAKTEGRSLESLVRISRILNQDLNDALATNPRLLDYGWPTEYGDYHSLKTVEEKTDYINGALDRSKICNGIHLKRNAEEEETNQDHNKLLDALTLRIKNLLGLTGDDPTPSLPSVSGVSTPNPPIVPLRRAPALTGRKDEGANKKNFVDRVFHKEGEKTQDQVIQDFLSVKSPIRGAGLPVSR